jgi:putative transposase
VLERLLAERGRPESLRCDNGPELTSRHFLAWCVERKIQLVHIEPGWPMQNGRVESFQGKFRDECLNVNWFRNLWEAREKVASWRREYNQTRPHSSLGYETQEAFAASESAPPASPPTLAGTSKPRENTSLSSMNFVSPSVRT